MLSVKQIRELKHASMTTVFVLNYSVLILILNDVMHTDLLWRGHLVETKKYAAVENASRIKYSQS